MHGCKSVKVVQELVQANVGENDQEQACFCSAIKSSVMVSLVGFEPAVDYCFMQNTTLLTRLDP